MANEWKVTFEGPDGLTGTYICDTLCLDLRGDGAVEFMKEKLGDVFSRMLAAHHAGVSPDPSPIVARSHGIAKCR